jgi:putative hydrolase of HD superfamily
MAILLSEYSNKRDIDLFKVIKMLLIHDLVEIDAGDTFLYDTRRMLQSVSSDYSPRTKRRRCILYGWNMKQEKLQRLDLLLRWMRFNLYFSAFIIEAGLGRSIVLSNPR